MSTTPQEASAHGLLVNGIVLHDLDFDEVRAACLGLSSTLLHPNVAATPSEDLEWFWAWCTHVIAGPRSPYIGQGEWELRELFGLVCRVILARMALPPHLPTEEDGLAWQGEGIPQREFLEVNPHARQLVSHAYLLVTYLGFPLLEALLKKESGEFVASDGTVLRAFAVPRAEGRRRDFRDGMTCSSIRDLLWLVYDNVASAELRSDLDELQTQLAPLSEDTGDGFNVLYRWRNSSLHRAAALTTVGGTVFNVAILVALHTISEEYEQLREAARREPGMPSTYSTPTNNAWSFYPP